MPQPGPKPKWFRRPIPAVGSHDSVNETINRQALHTVCVEAHCPNRMECYGRGEATFLLLGPSCTRGCTFCAVDKSKPAPPDPAEPKRTAEAVVALGLKFCVLTMVTRDDLPDGGAEHVAQTIRAIRALKPSIGVEVLISDLGGDEAALRSVLAAKPEVLNHNVETVPALYPKVRPQADYRRSLELLQRAGARGDMVTKSGLMLGLSESRKQVLEVMDDLRRVGCGLLTLGHYLAPSKDHHPVMAWAWGTDWDFSRPWPMRALLERWTTLPAGPV